MNKNCSCNIYLILFEITRKSLVKITLIIYELAYTFSKNLSLVTMKIYDQESEKETGISSIIKLIYILLNY